MLKDVFLRCVFERYDAVCHVCSTRKNRLWRQREPFLEHPTATCPPHKIHASQKFPQFCGIGRSWMLNKLCLELVPQKSLRERDLGHPNRLGDLLDTHALSCHLFNGEKFLCRAHHCARTMLVNTWYLTLMWLWCIDWCHVSVLCVDVKCAKVCCFVSFLKTWSIFHQKGAQKQT